MDFRFNDFFESYGNAFDNRDIEAVLNHYHYPCLMNFKNEVFACKNKDELRDVMLRMFRFLASEDSRDHVTSSSLTSLLTLADNNQIVSLIWKIENKKGQELYQFHVHYQIIQKDGTYKIVVVTNPDMN